MNFLIYYYSGAGNTKYIATLLKNIIKQEGNNVSIVRINENTIYKEDTSIDHYIIGFPIYDLTSPPSVKSLVSKISTGNLSFFCTKAFCSADSILELSKLSKVKNISWTEFYMPGTDMLGLFAKKESSFEKVLLFFHSRNINEKLNIFIDSIKNNNKKRIKKKWYVYFSPLIPNSLKSWFHSQYNRFVPEFYSIKNICIECMKCVRECPRNNIRFEKSIKFSLNCDMCLHCLHHCPTESIQIGNYTKETVRYKKVNIDNFK